MALRPGLVQSWPELTLGAVKSDWVGVEARVFLCCVKRDQIETVGVILGDSIPYGCCHSERQL